MIIKFSTSLVNYSLQRELKIDSTLVPKTFAIFIANLTLGCFLLFSISEI